MLRSLNFTLLNLLLATTLLACGTPVTTPDPSSTDAPTVTQTNPVTTNRVVALTSLSADLIHRLDKTKLVGIPGSRLLRQDPELAALPQVSEGQTPPNLEKIVALKPDLVIGATGFHDQILDRLKAAGIRTLATEVTSWQALQSLTQVIATEIGADPAPLLQSYQACVPTQPIQASSTLVLVSSQPLLSPNKTSWAGDLLTQFQIPNVVADLQGNSPQRGYVTLSPEKVLAANPKTLILVDAGDGAIAQLKTAPFWNQLDAVANNRIYTFDYFGLVNPGSIRAIEKTCQQLQQIITVQPS